MRSREDIVADTVIKRIEEYHPKTGYTSYFDAPAERNGVLILEVLLDIRDLLQNPPIEIVGKPVTEGELDAALKEITD